MIPWGSFSSRVKTGKNSTQHHAIGELGAHRIWEKFTILLCDFPSIFSSIKTWTKTCEMVLICHQRSAQLVCWSEAGPPEIDTHPKFNSSPLKNDGTGRRTILTFLLGFRQTVTLFTGRDSLFNFAGGGNSPAAKVYGLNNAVGSASPERAMQVVPWREFFSLRVGPRSFVATLKVA